MSDTLKKTVCALAGDSNKFDSTWGELLREEACSLSLCQSKNEFICKLKENSYDIVIVENIFNGELKGHTLISHLRSIKAIPLTTITIICSNQPDEFYSFQPFDLRPDFVAKYPFNKKHSKEMLLSAITARKNESEIRHAFAQNDHYKLEQLVSTSKEKYGEILYESASRHFRIESLEAKLYGLIENEIWPSYVLARHYVASNDLKRLSKLITLCQKYHGTHIGLSYLYFQGNKLITDLHIQNNMIASANSDFFQLPDYLFWISQQEFEKKNYKQAVLKQVEAIKSVRETSFETSSSYDTLKEYTDQYIANSSLEDSNIVNLASDCIMDARKRNLLDESLEVSAKIFRIRSKMLTGEISDLALELSDLFSANHEYLTKYPHVISDTVDTVLQKSAFKLVKEELEVKIAKSSPKIGKLIASIATDVKTPKRAGEIVNQAAELIGAGDVNKAEDKLTQVLGSVPGHHEATCLYIELMFKIIKSSNGFAKESHLNKIYSLIEKIKPSKTEWEKTKVREIREKLSTL